MTIQRLEHVGIVVDDLRARDAELVGDLVRYQNSYRLWCVRGPECIIIELSEWIG